MSKIKLLRISHSELGPDYHDDTPSSAAAEIESLLEGGEPGDVLTITLVEMDREAFEAMPEHDGW